MLKKTTTNKLGMCGEGEESRGEKGVKRCRGVENAMGL